MYDVRNGARTHRAPSPMCQCCVRRSTCGWGARGRGQGRRPSRVWRRPPASPPPSSTPSPGRTHGLTCRWTPSLPYFVFLFPFACWGPPMVKERCPSSTTGCSTDQLQQLPDPCCLIYFHSCLMGPHVPKKQFAKLLERQPASPFWGLHFHVWMLALPWVIPGCVHPVPHHPWNRTWS